GEPVTLVPGSGASNSTITIPADGCYNFALDVTDTAAPILTVTEVDVIPGTREVDLFDRLASLAAARGNYEALRRGTQDVIFTPSQGCSVGDTGNDPTEAFGVEMFARGTFNGWGAPSVDSFVNLGGGIYQANVLLSSGTEGYKVAAGDWSIELADENRPDPTPLDTEVLLESAVGPGEEGNIDVADDGCYSFTMNANDAAAPKLTISFLGAFDVIDVMAIQRDMEGAASVVVVVNNEGEEVDLTTLGGGGIPVPFADGPVVEITGADNDLVVSGGVLQGTVPARSSLLVSDQ
ncbi:MAG: hypothetical protein OEU49_13555, partial [Chromatiales bacterium]|nr:hypothetical protein [Chromatiales bacterium]